MSVVYLFFLFLFFINIPLPFAKSQVFGLVWCICSAYFNIFLCDQVLKENGKMLIICYAISYFTYSPTLSFGEGSFQHVFLMQPYLLNDKSIFGQYKIKSSVFTIELPNVKQYFINSKLSQVWSSPITDLGFFISRLLQWPKTHNSFQPTSLNDLDPYY